VKRGRAPTTAPFVEGLGITHRQYDCLCRRFSIGTEPGRGKTRQFTRVEERALLALSDLLRLGIRGEALDRAASVLLHKSLSGLRFLYIYPDRVVAHRKWTDIPKDEEAVVTVALRERT
jgi:hypothetical protein